MLPSSDGTEAIELLKRWRAHEQGSSEAANTLFAVFGVASSLGRFADKFGYNNPPYNMWLVDIAYDHVVSDPDDRSTPPSKAAAQIIANGLRRAGGRRVPHDHSSSHRLARLLR
jgi:hypothetical protein